ncbi:aspartate aminotransferase family protein [Bacillus sp. 1P02SD]|uniref:aspartate aminotransferase family protein n=1 Tax=Bacillus sp. 1P02SD TaxID=3132264 RepID=UPI0039A2DFA7
MDKWNMTKVLFDESQNYLASGVSSNLRLAMKPFPIYIREAHGAKLFDVDGNEYIDYIMAYGPQILGHSHPNIVNAICSQVKQAQTYGAQHVGEIELAKRIKKYVPCVDLVSYASTGSEAVQVALRLSRAFTGRQKFVRFEGHYHGWMDNIFTAFGNSNKEGSTNKGSIIPGTKGQNLKALEDTILLPWNNVEALEKTLVEHQDEIAAVITEPIMCNSGCILPLPGYMEKLRELTSKYGIVLIFDEVITGFRLGLGGAQEYTGITPDLVTMGKALAGGLPLSAVGGKKEIMELISRSEVYHMGTMNGNPLCTASAIASIDYLSDEKNNAYTQMNKLVDILVTEINNLSEQYNLPLLINRAGPVFHTMFTDETEITHFSQFQQRDSKAFERLAEIFLEEGLAVRPSGLWYLSTAHTEQDIYASLEIIDKSFQRFKNS